MPPRVLFLAAAAAAAVLVAGCGTTSVESVEGRVDGDPGVVKVRGWQEEGDGLPFVIQVPINLEVVMAAEATDAEILDVFAAYDDDIDDDVVSSVEVRLGGPARATLAAGGGIHVSEEMVGDLVAAQHDATIARYRRQVARLFASSPAVPDLQQSVEVALVSGGFDEVLDAVARYRSAEGINRVTVRSDGFTLTVDDVMGEAELTDAKVQLMRIVGDQFGLRAAALGSSSSLTLWVDAEDVPAARRLVEEHDELGWASVEAHR